MTLKLTGRKENYSVSDAGHTIQQKQTEPLITPNRKINSRSIPHPNVKDKL